MVGGYHHERFAVFSRPLEDAPDGAVEVVHLLHQHIQVIEVPVVVELRPFYHHKKAVRILIQNIDTLQGCPRQQVAPLGRHRRIDRIGYAEDALAFICLQLVPTPQDIIPFRLQFVENIPSVLPMLEAFCPAPEDIVRAAGRVVGNNRLFLVAVDVMATKIGGRGIPQAARYRDTPAQPFPLRQREQRLQFVAFRIHTDAVIVGFIARSERRTPRARIRNQAVGAIGLREAGYGTILEPELPPVRGPGRIDVHQAHAVANHQDDVLDALARRLRNLFYLVRGLEHVGLLLVAPFLGCGRGNEACRHQRQAQTESNKGFSHRFLI